MANKWTDDQRKVIDHRDGNILVAAAAGSGKTAVLVQRIISMVTSSDKPVDIDKILVLTFTRAAAGEMKARIRQAIDDALKVDPLNEHLQRQATLIHNAQIRTIDSFCAYVVRNYFHEIDLEPDFRTASEDELKIMKQQVMKDMLNNNFEAPTEEFKNLCDAYIKGIKLNNLSDMILDIFTVSQSFPYPKEWLKLAADNYDVSKDDLEDAGWLEVAAHLTVEIAKSIRHREEILLSICNESDGPGCYAKGIESDIALMDEIIVCKDYSSLSKVFQGFKWPAIGNKRGFTGDEAKLIYVKDERDSLKKLLDDPRGKYFSESIEDTAISMSRIAPFAKELLRLTDQFADAYLEAKRKKNIWDFNDVEHFALDILRDKSSVEHGVTNTARELAANFHEIMVDEYQDSNYLQEYILTAVCGGKNSSRSNYFNVGDIKQSIYSFRQATPDLFRDKFINYPTEPGESSIRIDLHQNFRSRREVLEFTNDIFGKIMKSDLGGVDYDDAAALYPGAEFENTGAEFEAEIIVGDLDTITASDDVSDSEFEAQIIADKISDLMQDMKISAKNDQNETVVRPLKYSDIVILLRSAKGNGDKLMEFLNDRGIPAYMSSETGYFTRPEVETVLAMLSVIDNAYQDIPLATVLRSQMFGVSDIELAEIRRQFNDKGISFSSAVFAYIKAHPEEAKLARFESLLAQVRDMSLDCPIHELIEYILKETGYLEYVSALPEGEAKKANLRRLIDEAIAYEKESYKSVGSFVHYIETLKSYEVDKGLASTVSENDDVVRIVTIHKSKGLEYPVVFLSGTGKGFNLSDAKDAAICNSNYGIAVKDIDPELRVKRDTLIHKCFGKISEMKTKGEELRVLYVALTRAKEKLIVTGVKKNLEDIIQRRITVDEDGYLSLPDRLSADCYLNWIINANKAIGDKYPVNVIDYRDIISRRAKSAGQSIDKRLQVEEMLHFADPLRMQIIDASTGFQYQGKGSSRFKNKYSVSELKHAAMAKALELEEDAAKPEFLHGKDSDKTPSGALYGTAVHRVWECFDFTRRDYREALNDELDTMVASGSLSEEDRGRLKPEALNRFLQSDLARRMHEASLIDELYKEQPFVFEASISELFEDAKDENDQVLIQGIIDVFFVEDDGIVLMDYKTDKVDTSNELMLRYKEQLMLYKDAIERAYGDMKVKEILIYSFALNETVKL